jgi:acyl-CoA thioesterase-1
MKLIRLVYAFTLVVAVGLILNSGEVFAKSESQPDSSKLSVLVWGDSLSAAYGIPVDKGWVSLLQDENKDTLSVVNGSISGETTQGGLTRLPDALEKFQPDLILLELGANDGLRGIKTEVIEENLKAMVELAQKADVDVVLLGIRIPLNYGFTYTQKFEQVFVDVAKEYELPMLPFLLEPVALDYDLMQSDGLHPTADAQPQVLAHVMTVLKDVLDEQLKPEAVSSSEPVAVGSDG